MNIMTYLWLAIIFVLSYLIGSVNTSIIVGKCLAGTDIRQHGSGNAGATNALRTLGKKAGILVIVGDCLKAVIAVIIAMLILPVQPLAVYCAGIGAVLGHNFPLYFKFKGGKGILSGGTIAIMIDWRIALVVWGGFIVLAVVTRYVSLGSCWAGASFPFATWFVYQDVILLVLSIVIGGLILYMHRANIHRLLTRTENKFSPHHKKG